MEQLTYRSLRTRAKWVTGAFAVGLTGIVYEMVLCLKGLSSFGEIEAEKLIMQAPDFGHTYERIQLIGGAALLACAVSFCIWTYGAARNARAFGAGLGETPGWAVGSYFIPILNLWKPYQILASIWRGSDPRGGSREPELLSGGAPPPWWFLTWWITWLASRLGAFWASKLLQSANNPDEIANGLHWLIGSLALEVIAAFFLLTVVWRLTRRQEERAGAVFPKAQVV